MCGFGPLITTNTKTQPGTLQILTSLAFMPIQTETLMYDGVFVSHYDQLSTSNINKRS